MYVIIGQRYLHLISENFIPLCSSALNPPKNIHFKKFVISRRRIFQLFIFLFRTVTKNTCNASLNGEIFTLMTFTPNFAWKLINVALLFSPSNFLKISQLELLLPYQKSGLKLLKIKKIADIWVWVYYIENNYKQTEYSNLYVKFNNYTMSHIDFFCFLGYFNFCYCGLPFFGNRDIQSALDTKFRNTVPELKSEIVRFFQLYKHNKL